jgi:hypothetical protein
MAHPAELAREILAKMDSPDVEGTIAPYLHEDFKYFVLPSSLGILVKSREECISHLKRAKTIILEYNVRSQCQINARADC